MAARHPLRLAPLKVTMNPRGVPTTGTTEGSTVKVGEAEIAILGVVAGVVVVEEEEEEVQEERVDHIDLRTQAGLGGRRMLTTPMAPIVHMIRTARTTLIGSGNHAFRRFPFLTYHYCYLSPLRVLFCVTTFRALTYSSCNDKF
jgi:hypothetical protein